MNKCSAEAGTIFLEMLTNLERIGDHAVTVAFCIPYKRPQQIPATLE
jgi:phosphate:Na+ symporter